MPPPSTVPACTRRQVRAPRHQNSPGMLPRAPESLPDAPSLPLRAGPLLQVVFPQGLAASRWQTEGLEMWLTLAFVPRPGSAAVVRAASPRPRRAIFYYRPLPQHRHWRIWAKPPPFRLRWRNVPGTRRNERTGFGLHGNWKKEVGYKSFATLLWRRRGCGSQEVGLAF